MAVNLGRGMREAPGAMRCRQSTARLAGEAARGNTAEFGSNIWAATARARSQQLQQQPTEDRSGSKFLAHMFW